MDHISPTPGAPGVPLRGGQSGRGNRAGKADGTARDACLLRALRDLFSARGADDLRAASLALDACRTRFGCSRATRGAPPCTPSGSPSGPLSGPPSGPPSGPDTIDTPDHWRATEYAFNRLFVGPMAVPAPPYASAWLETEPRLMGEAAMDMRALYHALGRAVPGEGATPDDHLSFELDAALALLALREAAGAASPSSAPEPSPSTLATDTQEAWRWLVAEHMGAWVPRFVQHALAEPDVPPAIARALAMLLCWQEDAAAACAPPRTEVTTTGTQDRQDA
ncbi:molecular chaperone TorD family protein [Nitratidesulfovibrio termitidis]|uniref:molecular chaperone TorD family protein n=1 Tax=Nitratidesulfovibrio termitidis TaxID=42252 RepID=UPI00041BD31E|nr:molecular chaperone TorD family protein [Nitratidesulfovibrio termitidis]